MTSGKPDQSVWAHYKPAPNSMPTAQSVKECIAVYRRPKTMENA